MARTPSTMIALGTPAPQFALPDTDGNIVQLSEYQGRPLWVMFICNHCPFVKHIRPQLAALAKEYMARGVGVVAINSNDAVNYPDDSPEKMRQERQEQGYVFPYLFDETQEVAKKFDAACTPDFFLYDSNHRLFYRGQFDESRPGNGVPVDGHDMHIALEAVLTGRPAPEKQVPSLGCNIKWK